MKNYIKLILLCVQLNFIAADNLQSKEKKLDITKLKHAKIDHANAKHAAEKGAPINQVAAAGWSSYTSSGHFIQLEAEFDVPFAKSRAGKSSDQFSTYGIQLGTTNGTLAQSITAGVNLSADTLGVTTTFGLAIYTDLANTRAVDVPVDQGDHVKLVVALPTASGPAKALFHFMNLTKNVHKDIEIEVSKAPVSFDAATVGEFAFANEDDILPTVNAVPTKFDGIRLWPASAIHWLPLDAAGLIATRLNLIFPDGAAEVNTQPLYTDHGRNFFTVNDAASKP